MATTTPCLAQLSRICVSGTHLTHGLPPRFLTPLIQVRHKGKKVAPPKVLSKTQKMNQIMRGAMTRSVSPNAGKKREKSKKASTTFTQYDLRDGPQWSLMEAMRYIRAFEVGQKPMSVKYEMHIKLKGLKNGPTVRNRIRLPHPVKTDLRICVICPPDSEYAARAKAAGAVLVGDDDIIEAVKAGKIEFDRCIAQSESLSKMNKAGLGRILGPKGLMPNAKTGTVVQEPSKIIKDLVGASEYRERVGVVRMAVGQLGFTPEELRSNIKSFMEAVKNDVGRIGESVSKDIVEVVLSSTNGPGFSLNGDFTRPDLEVTSKDLSTPA